MRIIKISLVTSVVVFASIAVYAAGYVHGYYDGSVVIREEINEVYRQNGNPNPHLK